MSVQALTKDFDKEMLGIYIRAKEEVNYTASRFHKMLREYGGVETAKILIHASNISEGYTILYTRKRLDLTVEAVIFDNPKWHDLFSESEHKIIKKRLRDYEYKNAL